MKKIFITIALLASIFCHGTEANNDSFDVFLNSFFNTFKESDIHHEFKYVQLSENPDDKIEPRTMADKQYGRESSDSIRKRIVSHYNEALKRNAVKSVNRTSASTYDVKFSGPDSGYLITFYFKKIAGHWKLIKFSYKSTGDASNSR